MADPRFKNLELKVGIFILSAVLLLVSAIVAYGIQKQLFVKKIRVVIISDTGESLSKGMPIKFSGFQIARADDVRLEDSGKVKIVAHIPVNYTKWIRSDSTVKLDTGNFIGAASIAFSGGTQEAPPIVNDEAFLLQRENKVDELIAKATPVLEDVKQIVEHVSTLTGRFADEKGDFNKLMHGLGGVGEDLSEKKGSIGVLARTDYLKNEIDRILRDVNKLSNNLVAITTKVDGITADVKNKTIDEVNKTVVEVKSSVQESERLLRSIRETVEKTDPTLANVREITNDIAMSTDNITLLRKEAEFIADTSRRMLLNLESKWPFNGGDDVPAKVNIK